MVKNKKSYKKKKSKKIMKGGGCYKKLKAKEHELSTVQTELTNKEIQLAEVKADLSNKQKKLDTVRQELANVQDQLNNKIAEFNKYKLLTERKNTINEQLIKDLQDLAKNKNNCDKIIALIDKFNEI